ncbi:MAG TPA: hypothetical protein VI306_26055 [Pyrinomonadaceae bacterium]
MKKKPAKPIAGRRFSITTLTIAIVVIAVAAITVASKQLAGSKATATQVAQTASSVTPSTAKKFVTVKVAGRDVQVDPQTGQIKPLTPEEAKQLADGLKTMLNKSTEGLEQVKNADGSVSMDLQGRFQNVAVARVNEDGTVEESCIDEPQQAATFFGIDPKLLGAEPVKGAAQPTVKSPARKVSK